MTPGTIHILYYVCQKCGVKFGTHSCPNCNPKDHPMASPLTFVDRNDLKWLIDNCTTNLTDKGDERLRDIRAAYALRGEPKDPLAQGGAPPIGVDTLTVNLGHIRIRTFDRMGKRPAPDASNFEPLRINNFVVEVFVDGKWMVPLCLAKVELPILSYTSDAMFDVKMTFYAYTTRDCWQEAQPDETDTILATLPGMRDRIVALIESWAHIVANGAPVEGLPVALQDLVTAATGGADPGVIDKANAAAKAYEVKRWGSNPDAAKPESFDDILAILASLKLRLKGAAVNPAAGFHVAADVLDADGITVFQASADTKDNVAAMILTWLRHTGRYPNNIVAGGDPTDEMDVKR